VLAGLMSESEFMTFLATYAVPENRANPIAAMREMWTRSAAAFKAQPPYVPQELGPWDPGWGDPSQLRDRPGMEIVMRNHSDATFAGAPIDALVVHHPSLDLDQADYWAARLGDSGNTVAPERNDAPVSFTLRERDQVAEIRSAYALLGAYFSAQPDPASPLPALAVGWQPGINVIQVGRLGDRLVLVNGHHRAYALARAGATVVPCLTYAIADLEIVGVSPGSAFDALLRSDGPPRLRHYLDPAVSVLVQLRRSVRLVTLSIREETIQER
jgi:hypothetical protein